MFETNLAPEVAARRRNRVVARQEEARTKGANKKQWGEHNEPTKYISITLRASEV